MKIAPTHISAVQEEYGSTLNTPCVGAATQHIFSNVQLNIASAELFEAGAYPSVLTALLLAHPIATVVDLVRSLGFYGGTHTDRNDDGAFPTGMLLHPQLPKGYSGGIFVVIDFAVFIAPKPRDIAFFSGRHRHGGTPPRAPIGTIVVDPDAYRLTALCYPNGSNVRGTAPTAFAPLGHGDGVLQVTPELRHRFE